MLFGKSTLCNFKIQAVYDRQFICVIAHVSICVLNLNLMVKKITYTGRRVRRDYLLRWNEIWLKKQNQQLLELSAEYCILHLNT